MLWIIYSRAQSAAHCPQPPLAGAFDPEKSEEKQIVSTTPKLYVKSHRAKAPASGGMGAKTEKLTKMLSLRQVYLFICQVVNLDMG
jgi:hypothetical protein